MSARAKVLEVEASQANPDLIFRNEMVALIPSLRSFARGLCGNPDMANDLCQECMMRAWAARDSYVSGTNFRAWMFTILRNEFYTTVRKNSRMTSLDPEMAERVLVQKASQQDGLHVADVANALNKLPAEQREALMLVGAHGVSYEEAAKITDCAIGTVKSRIARGRAALKRLIEEADDVSTETE